MQDCSMPPEYKVKDARMQSDLSVQVMPYISHVRLENFRGSVGEHPGENNRDHGR